MEDIGDGDVLLYGTSASAIADISHHVGLLGLEPEVGGISRSTAVAKIVLKLNIFQEDPQLLDAHLKVILQPLVDGFVAVIRTPSQNHETLQYLNDVAEVLYVLCKIRGYKIITRFFANEAKYVQPMLELFQKAYTPAQGRDARGLDTINPRDADANNNGPILSSEASWQLRYILPLWIGHLMLTPFDLSTVAPGINSTESLNMYLPATLPRAAYDVFVIGKACLSAATREQNAAANMLVKLALRPDMRKLGVLDSLNQWTLSALCSVSSDDITVLEVNGQLLFLHGLLTSADPGSVIRYLPGLYKITNKLFNDSAGPGTALQQSPTSKKLAIKIFRNMVSIAITSASGADRLSRQIGTDMLERMELVEAVIDYLLRSLADGDTQVRYAASKALSVVTTKLDPSMAVEVVDAVIGSFKEDLIFEAHVKNTSAVNPARWHGLTLTLSHMLFRRSTSTSQIADILDVLHSTLAFEQRSAIGNSIGANVRDAANFGLWSLARRYSTEELRSVTLPAAKGENEKQSSLQLTACYLLVAACLDPAGNVRRGSSAALQELIGRHPNTIIEGISLVQIADYHAVGLRGRAMTEVAVQAARLDDTYRKALLEALYEWRGVNATDTSSRDLAAQAIGLLVNLNPTESVHEYVKVLVDRLNHITRREVEWRQGLVQAISEVVSERIRRSNSLHRDASADQREGIVQDLVAFQDLWKLFDGPIAITAKELNMASSRPHLTTISTVALVTALSSAGLRLKSLAPCHAPVPTARDAALQVFKHCLKTQDRSTLEALHTACTQLGMLLDPSKRFNMVESWFKELDATRGVKTYGLFTALAAVWGTINDNQNADSNRAEALRTTILGTILKAAASEDVDTRVVAIHVLTLIIDAAVQSPAAVSSQTESLISQAIETALNDYTINERGDVGSLVRLEALEAVEHIWNADLCKDPGQRAELTRAVRRLAMERLDKIRLRAARCLMCIAPERSVHVTALPDVSTYTYYLNASAEFLLLQTAPSSAIATEDITAYLTGISSSTGAGSEALLQTARNALHDILSAMPLFPSSSTSPASSSSSSLQTQTCPPTLFQTTNCLLTLLDKSTNTDRTLLPLLETTAYLFDMGLLQLFEPLPSFEAEQQITPMFRYRTLLSLTQRSHYKSTSIAKLISCVSVYRGLASVNSVRALVLEKLVAMLGHPFPKVRQAVAETLLTLVWPDGVADGLLRERVWIAGVRENRDVVAGLRARILGDGGGVGGGAERVASAEGQG